METSRFLALWLLVRFSPALIGDCRVGEGRSEDISSPSTLFDGYRLAMAACLCQRAQLQLALYWFIVTKFWYLAFPFALSC